MSRSTVTVIEYSCGDELFVVMHNGKQIVIAVDTEKREIREFLPSMVLQSISTHPIYECSNEDRDQILAACDEAATRYLSSLSDEP